MTREEAINYAEAMKEKIQEKLGRFGNTHGPAVYYSDLAFLSAAISALREQEEREKGCEYCNEDCDGYRKMIGAFSITNPLHGNVWNIETCHCKPRQIYFCPMCGRMLTEPPKENDHET